MPGDFTGFLPWEARDTVRGAATPTKHVVALFNASDDTVEMAGRSKLSKSRTDLEQIKAAIHAALMRAGDMGDPRLSRVEPLEPVS